MSEIYTPEDLKNPDNLIEVVLSLANALTRLNTIIKYQDYQITQLSSMLTEILDDLKEKKSEPEAEPTQGVA